MTFLNLNVRVYFGFRWSFRMQAVLGLVPEVRPPNISVHLSAWRHLNKELALLCLAYWLIYMCGRKAGTE